MSYYPGQQYNGGHPPNYGAPPPQQNYGQPPPQGYPPPQQYPYVGTPSISHYYYHYYYYYNTMFKEKR